MPTKKLILKSETDMFGTNLELVTKDGSHKFVVGTGLAGNPVPKLNKRLNVGYLFRSPKVQPEALAEIWETVNGFEGAAAFTAEIDTKTEEVTAYMRIAEMGDAGMFAFSHNLFEKWSDSHTEAAKVEKKKQKKSKLTVNDDGTVQVTVEVTTLGD